jgi:hypothetical protein
MDKVTAEKGYAGPVVVCSAGYEPIAGHRASLPDVSREHGRELSDRGQPVRSNSAAIGCFNGPEAAVTTMPARADVRDNS